MAWAYKQESANAAISEHLRQFSPPLRFEPPNGFSPFQRCYALLKVQDKPANQRLWNRQVLELLVKHERVPDVRCIFLFFLGCCCCFLAAPWCFLLFLVVSFLVVVLVLFVLCTCVFCRSCCSSCCCCVCDCHSHRHRWWLSLFWSLLSRLWSLSLFCQWHRFCGPLWFVRCAVCCRLLLFCSLLLAAPMVVVAMGGGCCSCSCSCCRGCRCRCCCRCCCRRRCCCRCCGCGCGCGFGGGGCCSLFWCRCSRRCCCSCYTAVAAGLCPLLLTLQRTAGQVAPLLFHILDLLMLVLHFSYILERNKEARFNHCFVLQAVFKWVWNLQHIHRNCCRWMAAYYCCYCYCYRHHYLLYTTTDYLLRTIYYSHDYRLPTTHDPPPTTAPTIHEPTHLPSRSIQSVPRTSLEVSVVASEPCPKSISFWAPGWLVMLCSGIIISGTRSQGQKLT